MLEAIHDYDRLRTAFRWQIPSRYNIAVAACDAFAEREPDRLAILHQRADGRLEEMRYGALREASNRLANALVALGVRKGDRVAIILPQSPEVVIAHLALYKLGALALPLAALFGPDALEYRLRDSGARAAILDQAAMARLAPIRDRLGELSILVSVDGGEGAQDFAALMTRASPAFTPVDSSPDDPAMMIYTSGTTGPPKGALHGHRVVLGHMPGVQWPHEFLPQPGDLIWTPADWAWAGGLLNVLLPSLALGVPVVARRFEKFDPQEAMALIAQAGIRNAFIPPTALRMMRAAGISPPAGARLRTIASGGESLGAEVYDWGRSCFGLTINEFYGQTECNLVLASCAAAGVSRAGTIGRSVPGHEAAVIRPDGSLCEPDEEGEIAVRAPNPVMFLGYWKNPAATRRKYRNGWLVTGDRAICDADGYVRFVGRDDDLITSSGYRIGPSEIEDCLMRHPAVAIAAAVGKPDPIRTEIVKAFIVPRPGIIIDDALTTSIQDFVRGRLSAHEYPREIAYVDTLPMTTSGKIMRRLLRDRP